MFIPIWPIAFGFDFSSYEQNLISPSYELPFTFSRWDHGVYMNTEKPLFLNPCIKKEKQVLVPDYDIFFAPVPVRKMRLLGT